MKITEIELYKENFKFSSGHFTIFSATERERLHGHNFNVFISFKTPIEQDGIIFDYSIAKNHIQQMCRDLNEYFLLPEKSRHLKFGKENGYISVEFNGEKLLFLEKDIKLLPIENITVEDLSHYFLDSFIKTFIEELGYTQIIEVTAKVFSGPGQNGGATWKKN